jgi:hypothetical protein
LTVPTKRTSLGRLCLVPHLTTACQVRHVRVSVPLIAALVDNQRYYLPEDLAPPVGEELLYRPRITGTKAVPSPQQESEMPSPPMRAPARRACATWSGWRGNATRPRKWASD